VCGFYEQIPSTAKVTLPRCQQDRNSGSSSVLSVEADRFDHEVELVGAVDVVRYAVRRAGPDEYAALRAVNLELLSLYWDIGQLVSNRQEEETWGRSVVETLAKDLRAEFPGISGFSAANLWRIKQFSQGVCG
jgi:hypothetical protein